MARLNEIPAPAAETLESVKRRFNRQNREIARVNSTQSIRIRNLETEISRLLAENIAIREEAIGARAEADRWKATHRLNKEILRMKETLEDKLSEVSALVGELGALPEKVARRSSQRRRKDGFVGDLRKGDTAEDREPRQRQTLLEQEGRLPAILEDKSYPRRTLETLEIKALQDEAAPDATESPDLGPPPVAHFDEPEIVTFNAMRSPRRTSTELIEESERGCRSSVSNVENRRKRRASTLLQSSEPDSHAPDTYEPELVVPEVKEPEKREVPEQPQSILKKGAKRKLEVSELEDTSRVSKELDDFIFQRKQLLQPAAARPSRFSRPPGREDQEVAQIDQPRSPDKVTKSTRRILAPKSTNSPTKRRVDTSFEKTDIEHYNPSIPKPEKRVVSRIRSRPTAIDLPLPSASDAQATAQSEKPKLSSHSSVRQMHPKTPAPEQEDFLSPIATEPSTKQRPLKEMAVINSVEDVLNGSIGRGSRRARAAVSYAEPNLRDKMRRPGKALVGAVEGLAAAKQSVDGEHDRGDGSSTDIGIESAKQNSKNGVVRIKGDRETEEEKEVAGWHELREEQDGKSEPASPLRGKVAPIGRRSDYEEHDAESIKATAQFSVFDPPSSSPITSEEDHAAIATHRGKEPTDVQVSNSRRHSIQPRSTSRHSAEETSSSISGVATSRTQRPNSALEVRSTRKQEGDYRDSAKGYVKRAASVTNLTNAGQLRGRLNSTARQKPAIDIDASGAEEQEVYQGRSTLGRRRSMMV